MGWKQWIEVESMKIVVDDADFHSIVIENQGLYYADLTR